MFKVDHFDARQQVVELIQTHRKNFFVCMSDYQCPDLQ